MKILFLAQIVPYPLDSGVKFRTYFTLRQLASEHDVTLVCFVRSDNTDEQIAHLRGVCRAVHVVPMVRSRVKDVVFLTRSVLLDRPLVIERDTAPAMQRLIDGLLHEAEAAGQPFQAIHCDQLWMAQYALRGVGVKKLLDQHNAYYLIPKRMAANERSPVKRAVLAREWRKLARYEAAACARFDHVVTVTEEDRQLLRDLVRPSPVPITVLPICIDPSSTPFLQRDPASKTVIHLGTMYWPPNVDGVLWFAREVFPLVKRRIPEARFCIVGKNPPPEVVALASDPAVEVTGYVADPQPYLRRSAAFLVPLRAGGGMRVKILDGWLWGVPIVSTSIGAEGIETQSGEQILVADDAPAFAEAVVRLIQQPELGQALALNGRRWVETRYNWRVRYQELSDLYRDLEKR